MEQVNLKVENVARMMQRSCRSSWTPEDENGLVSKSRWTRNLHTELAETRAVAEAGSASEALGSCCDSATPAAQTDPDAGDDGRT
mmetsp:Transcript_160364/g.510371  ORF Transcript_160364/g.510371 Transcript_160364/m.510371 type:complete len:85 (-) Transcript_160364:140-394(-)